MADDAVALVVGSHDHGAVARMVLGSVSRGCIERSRRPVCVVSPGWPRSGDGRIVVASEGPTASARALEWAQGEAALRHAELHIVHGGDRRDHASRQAAPTSLPLPDVERPGRLLLDEMVASTVTVGDDVRIVETWPSGDNPADDLLRAAAGADLLVVGAARRGRHTVVSAFGRHGMRHMACPVVVVPPPE
jgi:nucleotide-binding universal stress UspA family protein